MQRAGDPATVLHVDDEPGLADATAEMLEREDEGLTVEPATSVEAGLERLAQGDVECVLSGYKLGGTTGVEFLERVREDHPALPFVLYTAHGSERVASEAVAAGATDYVRKAAGADNVDLLGNRLRNAVEGYRDRRRAERLREERELVARAATDVFYVVDFRTGELRMSDGVTQFGYDPDEVRRDNEWWRERVHPEDREWMEGRLETTTEPTADGFESVEGVPDEGRGRAKLETEYRRRRADGSYAHVVGAGVTVFEDGRAVKQVGTMRDVTERVARERELHRQNERLEELVGVVSHDLRNPLNVASTRLELAAEDGEAGDHVAAAAEAVDRGVDIVEDLLTLAREGRREVETEPVELAAAAERCWRHVVTADAELTVTTGLTLRADPRRLDRLLENLLRNAVVHGGADVTVRVGATDDGAGFYMADDREAVFEAGYSTGDEGTGLGLAIVEQLTQAHDWAVTVAESAAGGARFEVTGVEPAD